MLRNLSLNLSYNTSEHNISKDFYEPVFANSIEYKRGVGYFTSGWLRHNAKGLAHLIENGGKIKFITSPILDKNDIQALEGKYDRTKIDDAIIKNINEIAENLEYETRNLLGWLVEDGIIEFKFAILKNHLEGGEFHDKFGVLIDGNNHFISFNGSMNDSIKSNYNYESISVFKSWGDETSRFQANDHLQRFNRLWAEEDTNISVFSINELIKEKLLKLKTTNERPYLIAKAHKNNNMNTKPTIPNQVVLRDYQEQAYKKWEENNFRGILSMATGSGKTITAFSSIAKLSTTTPHLAAVVIVPYQHLLEQWADEAKQFNISFLKCFESSQKWYMSLSNEITKFNFFQKDYLFIIATNSTYTTKKFQTLLKELSSFLLIVDEAHNFGATNIRQLYLENAKFRLGLSATPERHLDEEGSEALKKYLGKIIFEYTLEDAIKSGKLTPYKYFPVLVHLTENEEIEYIELSKKISAIAQYQNEENNAYLNSLLIKRARIIASAENKVEVLKRLIKEENLAYSAFNLFYCAAKIDAEEDGALRMVDKVKQVLTDLGMQVKNFTSFDAASKEERHTLIDDLKEQIIDGLVAIRCLDEGVDIPAVRRAFIMSSSSNPKEFIQRRGRVLRKSEGKKFAEIYDFIVIPKDTGSDEYNQYNKKYFKNELIRYREFARLAMNYPECEIPLVPLIKTYSLQDI
ncbi:MAG: DEAD/DEAH box helicase family protein [Sulfuricurvum sp.]|uniref:DEAD/DEAH box helicase family protein n=1 Tax=Sulfuricurvum sp. TaxID=2025608 RepID=UPI0026292830|nr:DEAD/DEAH box helicase family protein [Sulfuricurvum sp.]MDD5161114.1 DEAD/DEAH box helicase family protein [Sulfuricurvum sp.]